MRISFLAPTCLGLAVLTLVAQSQPEQLRQRSFDVATPGTFGGLKTTPVEYPSVNTEGDQVSLPQVWETDPTNGAEFRRGELLVRFRSDANVTTKIQAAIAASVERSTKVFAGGWELVTTTSATTTANALNALRTNPVVLEASLDYRSRPTQHRPNDEFFNLQWNFEAIDLPHAWEINPGSRPDVIVAVIDTGLNVVTDTFVFTGPYGRFPIRFAQVPDLVTDERIIKPFDFVYGDEFPLDLGGHGTHVAGTIGQLTDNSVGLAGVAYNVRLMPLKVISGGDFVSWDDVFFPGNRGGSSVVIASAIRYAADNGANVINLSLGGSGPEPIIRDAIVYAVQRGVFVAIAAGNAADEGNPVFYPASYATDIAGAVAVGAVNRENRRAFYSGFKPYVEICAPGGELVTSELDYTNGITQVTYDPDSTLPGLSGFAKVRALRRGFRPRFDQFDGVPFQGTSMATPHISGIAALLFAQGIRQPRAIEEAIKTFARHIDASADECGAGLVDPRRTLRGLGLAR